LLFGKLNYYRNVFLVIAVSLLAAFSIPILEPTHVQTQPASVTFQTTGLTINPAMVNPGGELVIMAEVTNICGTESTYTAVLKINDIDAATLKTTMAAGESKHLSFAGYIAVPGTYEITWAESTGGVLVPRLTGELVVLTDEPIGGSDSYTFVQYITAVDDVAGGTISLSRLHTSTGPVKCPELWL